MAESSRVEGRNHRSDCGCGWCTGRRTHGDTIRRSPTPEYKTWSAIRQRCTNPNNKNYASCGGRGISVCERWSDFTLFLADMGRKPGGNYSIARIDSSGDYEPGNCLWVRRHGDAPSGTARVTPEYRAWAAMRDRCSRQKNPKYHLYGGRGISVCDRWGSYENFLADMGRRPSPAHSLDRGDNYGNYEPGNCRWATRSEQSGNRRPYRWKRNRLN